MKYVKRQMRVAEVTKMTAMGLVLTALALFGGDQSAEVAPMMSDLYTVVEEAEQTRSVRAHESPDETEEPTLYDVEFIDDTGKRLTVLVNSAERRVVRVGGDSFDLSS